MDAAVLFSGGKDSTLALYKAMSEGWNVKYLVSIFPESSESYMFHYPNVELTRMQAEAIGIPIITKATTGKKEKELEDLEGALASIKDEINAVVSGALASEYQKSRIDRICRSLGLKSHAPLWKRDPGGLWRFALVEGFEIIITGVACEGLGKEWLGRVIDEQSFEELKNLSGKYNFHLGFEGGEAETFVLNCPIFKKSVKIVKARKKWHGDSGFYLIEKAALSK
jgi:diphthine-ammonia ligase